MLRAGAARVGAASLVLSLARVVATSAVRRVREKGGGKNAASLVAMAAGVTCVVGSEKNCWSLPVFLSEGKGRLASNSSKNQVWKTSVMIC